FDAGSRFSIVTEAWSLSRMLPRVCTVVRACDTLSRFAMFQANWWRRAMQRAVFAILALAAASSVVFAQGRPTRFWNLTRHTISEFYLAPTGSSNWGVNQCKNDKDGTVDPDERLRISGVAPGIYDAKLKDVSGRSCLVRNIKIEAGEIFSIDEKD